MATLTVTPPPAASTTSLYGLPNELLLNITGYLEREELIDLRLVCRRFGRHFYPRMPTEWTIVADSPRQLRKLIKMTEPGQLGCPPDKLTLVETLPVYLSREQYVEGGNLGWTKWTPKGPPELAEESSSEYEPSECSSEEYEEEEDMEEDWEAEDNVGSEEENDDDLDLEELTTKYADVLKTSDDPTIDWETLWPPYYLPPYYQNEDLYKEKIHGIFDDIESGWRWPLGSRDRKEKTLTTLLARAFRNLARAWNLQYDDGGYHDHRLELDLKVASLKSGVAERNVDCKAPAVMFGELFHRVAVSLHNSKLPISKLTLGHGKAVLDCFRLEEVLLSNQYTVELDLRPSFSHLRKLSIKFAHSSEDTVNRWGNPDCSHIREAPTDGIVKFLRLTACLNTLHLHGYHAWRTNQMLEAILRSCRFYHNGNDFKSITLEGFGTREGEVRDFLTNFKCLRSLTLKGLYLTPEEYERVFEIIEKEEPELSNLHLNNLYEVDSKTGSPEDACYLAGSDPRLVYFEGTDPSHFSPDHGPNFITRRDVEARTAIQKKAKLSGKGKSSDSSAYLDWQRRWNDNYGGFPESP